MFIYKSSLYFKTYPFAVSGISSSFSFLKSLGSYDGNHFCYLEFIPPPVVLTSCTLDFSSINLISCLPTVYTFSIFISSVYNIGKHIFVAFMQTWTQFLSITFYAKQYFINWDYTSCGFMFFQWFDRIVEELTYVFYYNTKSYALFNLISLRFHKNIMN